MVLPAGQASIYILKYVSKSMENVEIILGIIGSVSGVISILAIVYLLGYKLGRIEAKLDFFDPKEFGTILGTVNTISKIYERDFEKKIREITMEVLSKSGAISENPKLDIRKVNPDVLERIGELIGVEIKEIHIFKEFRNMEGTEINTIDELVPSSYFFLDTTIVHEGREIEIFSKYQIDENMNLEVVSSQIGSITLKEEDKKNAVSSEMMNNFLTGYGERIRDLLTIFLQTLIRITLSAETVR